MKSLLLFLVLFPLSAFSQSITSVELEKDTLGRVSLAKVNGDGFGVKNVPVFYEQASHALENGVVNSTFSEFGPDRLITKRDTLWNPSSQWSNVHGNLFIQENPFHSRSPDSGKYFYGSSIHTHIQNPRVHPRSGTPNESKKVYISWWFKQQNETRNYFQHELGAVDDGFNPAEGDEFVVDVGAHWSGVTKVYGRVIAYFPATKLLHANYYGQNNTNRINGKRFELLKDNSGATLALAKRGPGSNKYIRVWESDGAVGTFRSSWTNTEIYQADFRRVQRSNVKPREWNHMEFFADQETKYIKTKVNGVVDSEGFYTESADAAGHSPTIGLIGLDSNQNDMIQQIWMDDIYVDTSFKRITLSNSPTYAGLTHEEVQFHTSWTNNQITFAPYYGSLNKKDPVYIYVHSEDNSVNETGVLLVSPPEMQVEL